MVLESLEVFRSTLNLLYHCNTPFTHTTAISQQLVHNQNVPIPSKTNYSDNMASPPRVPNVPLLLQVLNQVRHLATAGDPGQLAGIQAALLRIEATLGDSPRAIQPLQQLSTPSTPTMQPIRQLLRIKLRHSQF